MPKVKNSVRTSKGIAKKAGKALRNPKTPKEALPFVASALRNRAKK